jgi:hypothetical protein
MKKQITPRPEGHGYSKHSFADLIDHKNRSSDKIKAFQQN